MSPSQEEQQRFPLLDSAAARLVKNPLIVLFLTICNYTILFIQKRGKLSLWLTHDYPRRQKRSQDWYTFTYLHLISSFCKQTAKFKRVGAGGPRKLETSWREKKQLIDIQGSITFSCIFYSSSDQQEIMDMVLCLWAKRRATQNRNVATSRVILT